MNDRQYNAKVEDLNRRMRMIEAKRCDCRRHGQELEFIAEELNNCNCQAKQLLGEIEYRWSHDRQLQAHIVEGMHITDQIVRTNADFYQAGEDALNDQRRSFNLEEESIDRERGELNSRAAEDYRANQDFGKDSF